MSKIRVMAPEIRANPELGKGSLLPSISTRFPDYQRDMYVKPLI